MNNEDIAEIEIDAAGNFFVKPERSSFSDLYRAGAWGFRWDGACGRLVSPEPDEWSYADWYRHIITVIASQYGVILRTSPATIWTSVPVELRHQIDRFDRSDWPADLAERQKRDSAASWQKFELDQALSQAAHRWEQSDFEGYSRVLGPFEDRLSPAQLKRLKIARRQANERGMK